MLKFPVCEAFLYYHRHSSIEKIIIDTLNNESRHHNVSFELQELNDREFVVSINNKLLCQQSFVEMEKLLYASISTYNLFWNSIIEDAITTESKRVTYYE